MKKFILQLVILVVVIFVALMFATAKSPDIPFFPQQTQSSKLQMGNTLIDVEIADNTTKRKQGLGGRKSLASDSGMLFIFDKPDRYTFWMKGLVFPLDMIWIRDDKVVDFIKNATPPSPDQKDETLPIYAPNQPIDKVLEVNAGFVDINNIKIGDSIQLK